MNFRYAYDADAPLKRAIARNPRATLNDLRRAHPSLRRMSVDHLALRLEQIAHRQACAPTK